MPDDCVRKARNPCFLPLRQISNGHLAGVPFVTHHDGAVRLPAVGCFELRLDRPGRRFYVHPQAPNPKVAHQADLMEEELLELAGAEIEELIEPTFLNGCEIVPVSSTTGAGLDQLAAALERCAGQITDARSGDRFRMPVDRSFSIKGAGTVVTGTPVAGTLKLEDELQVMPGGKRARP